SVKRVFFIGISSFILPRKFHFRIPLGSGGITPGTTGKKLQDKIRCRAVIAARKDRPLEKFSSESQRDSARKLVARYTSRSRKSTQSEHAL
ncbi:hypothetical protein, partial [Rhodobacter sp. JA431]|uniref:hypothetical protein n=1 Tax=Rhodobacter sp. JA431 TaxID=570013 RepID=UPI001BAFC3C6